jgi:hypothetical protein
MTRTFGDSMGLPNSHGNGATYAPILTPTLAGQASERTAAPRPTKHPEAHQALHTPTTCLALARHDINPE